MLNAYFRDLQYTVNFLVHLLFWLTPIIYPAELIPDRYRFLFQINPVALIITAWRDLFLNHVIDWTNVGLAYLISLSVLALGILTFRVLGKKLDEFL
jgi:ABC-type polysaccharide/polyol phosphate export permease